MAFMISAARILMLASIVLTGCGTVEKAAVTTFRVVDAPANYVRKRIDSSPTTTTTTTTAGVSDVVTPGQPVNPPSGTPPTGSTRVVENSSTSRTSPTVTDAPVSPRKPPSSPSAQKPGDFPIARPVPGKPGYVYSLDSQGGIVDVTGYKSGDKAKDPYTKQVFIIP
jgi:hypothetical protein